MRILLGSTSRYRRELVQRLGVDIEAVASPYDEEAAKIANPHLPLEELVVLLAHGKARAVAEEAPDALVIGSDQMGELDGESSTGGGSSTTRERLGKPHTFEAACAQLQRLQGRSHRLLTAVAVHHRATGREAHLLDVHTLVMRPLTPTQIERYVRADEPLDCAGSYRVESRGIALFERISGDDFTSVIGLPLTKTVALLRQLGFDVLGE